MFSVLPSYVTLQDVVHLCPDNEAVILHFTCVGISAEGSAFLSPACIQGKHAIHTLCALTFSSALESFFLQ